MKTKNNNLEVTIDELAIMIGKGFRGVDEQFHKVDLRFDSLERRVSNIEENMAMKDDIKRLEVKFDGLERVAYKDHEPRLRRVERKLQVA